MRPPVFRGHIYGLTGHGVAAYGKFDCSLKKSTFFNLDVCTSKYAYNSDRGTEREREGGREGERGGYVVIKPRYYDHKACVKYLKTIG